MDAIKARIEIPQHKKPLKKLTENCLNNLSIKSVRTDLLNCLKTNLRPIMKCVTTDCKFPKKIYWRMKAIDGAIKKYLENVDYSAFLEPGDFDPPLKVTARNLYDEMNEYLEDRYSFELHEKDELDLVYYDLLAEKKYISTKQKSKTRAEKLALSFKFSRCQQEYFREINLTDRIQLWKFNDEFDRNFLMRRMQELISCELNRGELSIIQNKLLKDNADFDMSEFREYEAYMEAFKPCTIKTFRKLIQEVILKETRSIDQDLIELIEEAIQDEFEKHVWRKSLPTMHLHKISSTVHYITSLRLTRRSLYRTYRNQSKEKSILGESKEGHHDIGWQFQNIGHSYVAIERTRIIKKACSSLIQIETRANNYLELGEKIQSFLDNNSTYSDRHFVLWIRQTITGREALEFNNIILPKARHDLTLFLIQLAHLFVGTESIRHPAALVQSQMVMDLIEVGSLTWSQAFKVSDNHIYYPMILTGATSACRTLAERFSTNSFYSYEYPGSLERDDEKVLQYITAEFELTSEWLKFFNGKKEKSISQAIWESIPHWYPGLQVHH